MHDSCRGIVSLDDEADLGLSDQYGVRVVLHRIDWVSGPTIVTTPIRSQPDAMTQSDSGTVSPPVAGYGIPLQWLPLDDQARPNAEVIVRWRLADLIA
jgi:hypothetical protein